MLTDMRRRQRRLWLDISGISVRGCPFGLGCYRQRVWRVRRGARLLNTLLPPPPKVTNLHHEEKNSIFQDFKSTTKASPSVNVSWNIPKDEFIYYILLYKETDYEVLNELENTGKI